MSLQNLLQMDEIWLDEMRCAFKAVSNEGDEAVDEIDEAAGNLL